MDKTERGRVITGARARFSLNGVVFAFAVNVNVREELQYEDVEVLDNIEVAEHAPIAYRCSMSASQVRVVGQTIRALGFFPSVGESPTAHLLNILTQEDLVAQIEDRKTQRVLARVFGVKVSSRDFTVNARGVVNEDLAFVAIRMQDESEAI